MDDKLNKVIAKVKALHSLAKNNTMVEEIKAATEAADRLMQQYRISQVQLEDANEIKPDPMTKKEVYRGGKRRNWVETILAALTSRYGCFWYMYSHQLPTRTLTYHIVGRESDTEIVSYLLSYLVREGERLTAVLNKGRGVAYGKNWLEGFGLGIAYQFAVLIQKEKDSASVQNKVADDLMRAIGKEPLANTSQALVLLDRRAQETDAFVKQDVELKRLKMVGTLNGARSDANAHRQGFERGRRVQISASMHTETTTHPKIGR